MNFCATLYFIPSLNWDASRAQGDFRDGGHRAVGDDGGHHAGDRLQGNRSRRDFKFTDYSLLWGPLAWPKEDRLIHGGKAIGVPFLIAR